MEERTSVRKIKWKKLGYLAAVFLGCTTVVLLPFFGIAWMISAILWLVAAGLLMAALSSFLLAPKFVKAKKFETPPKK